MKVIITPENKDVTDLIKGAKNLKEVLMLLGVNEEEVICIDRIKNCLLLLFDRLEQDCYWEIRRVLSQG